ncbi:hypothetical protein AMTRI_Chr01g106090 [Amborella trichopoda]
MDPSRAAPPRVPSAVHPRPAMTHLSTPWPDREPQNGHKKTARAHARAHARDAQSAHGTRHLGTLARRTHARTAVGSPSSSLPTTRSPPRGPRPTRRGCAMLGLAGGTRGTVGLDAQPDARRPWCVGLPSSGIPPRPHAFGLACGDAPRQASRCNQVVGVVHGGTVCQFCPIRCHPGNSRVLSLKTYLRGMGRPPQVAFDGPVSSRPSPSPVVRPPATRYDPSQHPVAGPGAAKRP